MAANAGSNASGELDTSTRTGEVASTIEQAQRCPVCDVAFDSVSVHETGLMVNLIGNERYRRVCFEPVGEDEPRIRFYHHTHEQTALPE